MIFQDPLVANVLATRVYSRLRDLAANPDEPQVLVFPIVIQVIQSVTSSFVHIY